MELWLHTERSGIAAILLTHICEMFSLNLDQDSGYLEVFCSFLSPSGQMLGQYPN
jgi:hypothetical protein